MKSILFAALIVLSSSLANRAQAAKLNSIYDPKHDVTEVYTPERTVFDMKAAGFSLIATFVRSYHGRDLKNPIDYKLLLIQTGPDFKYEGINSLICQSGINQILTTQITRVVTKETPVKQEMVSVILDEKQIEAIANTQGMNCRIGSTSFSFSDITINNLKSLMAGNRTDSTERSNIDEQPMAIEQSLQDAAKKSDVNHAPTNATHTPLAAARAPTTSPSPRNSGSGGSCLCINHDYCTGPRGGVYCYTSGGNKRYIGRGRR